MQFDEKSIALVKNSSITLALVFTLVAVYECSLDLIAFGLLAIAFVPLSVWALDFFPSYVWFRLLVLLHPIMLSPLALALTALRGLWSST